MLSVSQETGKSRSAEHVVQLYGSDEPGLFANGGRFLSEGLARGDALIVIATAQHCEAFARAMKDHGAALEQGLRDGRVLFLNAPVTLDGMMLNGQPDRQKFEGVMLPAVDHVLKPAGRTSITAYGEMVGLLWTRGEQAAAIQLEQYWNELLARVPMNLFCAYPIDLFRTGHLSGLDPVLCSHTHLIPVNQGLESAIGRAMEEVLGDRAATLKLHIKTNLRPEWAAMPTGEAILLWLRTNPDASADEILDRARRYYQAAAA